MSLSETGTDKKLVSRRDINEKTVYMINQIFINEVPFVNMNKLTTRQKNAIANWIATSLSICEMHGEFGHSNWECQPKDVV